MNRIETNYLAFHKFFSMRMRGLSFFQAGSPKAVPGTCDPGVVLSPHYNVPTLPRHQLNTKLSTKKL